MSRSGMSSSGMGALAKAVIALSMLLAPVAATAAVTVKGRSTVLTWPGGTGPVAGYYVMVHRNGSDVPDLPLGVASAEAPVFELTGRPGDRVRVRVAAFDSEGNVGPASPFSPKIRFVRDSSGSAGGGSGGGGAAGPEAPEIPTGVLPGCADELLVLGQDRLRIRGRFKEKSPSALRGVLCDGDWHGLTVGSAIWSGRFERVQKKKFRGKKRKLDLEPDADTTEAILEALEERFEAAGAGVWSVALRKPARMRVKANRRSDRVRWLLDLKLELVDPVTSRTRRGAYRLDLRGGLSPQLASALWP